MPPEGSGLGRAGPIVSPRPAAGSRRRIAGKRMGGPAASSGRPRRGRAMRRGDPGRAHGYRRGRGHIQLRQQRRREAVQGRPGPSGDPRRPAAASSLSDLGGTIKALAGRERATILHASTRSDDPPRRPFGRPASDRRIPPRRETVRPRGKSRRGILRSGAGWRRGRLMDGGRAGRDRRPKVAVRHPRAVQCAEKAGCLDAPASVTPRTGGLRRRRPRRLPDFAERRLVLAAQAAHALDLFRASSYTGTPGEAGH